MQASPLPFACRAVTKKQPQVVMTRGRFLRDEDANEVIHVLLGIMAFEIHLEYISNFRSCKVFHRIGCER